MRFTACLVCAGCCMTPPGAQKAGGERQDDGIRVLRAQRERERNSWTVRYCWCTGMRVRRRCVCVCGTCADPTVVPGPVGAAVGAGLSRAVVTSARQAAGARLVGLTGCAVGRGRGAVRRPQGWGRPGGRPGGRAVNSAPLQHVSRSAPPAPRSQLRAAHCVKNAAESLNQAAAP